MKFAWMAKVLPLAALGSLALVTPAAAATEGVTPLRASVSDGGAAVASGTDIFWTSERKSKSRSEGYTYTSSLWRTSFLGGTKTLVKRFDPKDTATGFPNEVFVGGDFVYVNMEGDGPSEDRVISSTTVLRMRRDGSDLQKIASGQLNSGEEDSIVIEKGKGRLNDCGTAAVAQFATSDGSVVILETKADRESKACGRKKNVDHDRYYLLSPAGIKREILTEDVRIERKIKVFKDGSWEGTSGSTTFGVTGFVADVVGDRALLLRAKGRKIATYVRDLNTGTETGPYKSPDKDVDELSFGSLDASGRVALTAFAVRGSRKKPSVRISSGIFRTPGDPASLLAFKGQGLLMFCGNHLIAETSKGVRELDPVTLNLLRPIAPLNKDGYEIDDCDANFVHMTRQTKDFGAKFLAYPLR